MTTIGWLQSNYFFFHYFHLASNNTRAPSAKRMSYVFSIAFGLTSVRVHECDWIVSWTMCVSFSVAGIHSILYEWVKFFTLEYLVQVVQSSDICFFFLFFFCRPFNLSVYFTWDFIFHLKFHCRWSVQNVPKMFGIFATNGNKHKHPDLCVCDCFARDSP